VTGVTETGNRQGYSVACTQFCYPVIPFFFCPYNDRGDWVQGVTTLGCPRVLKTSNLLDLEDLLVEGDCTYAFSAPLKAARLC